MPYLLDTNIVSDLVRNPKGKVAARVAAVGQEEVFTSIIVAAELRYGAVRKKSPRLMAQIQAVLGGAQILDLKPPADRAYADLRATLDAQGTPISANDLFIAAHAVALGHILVTDNEREFARVPGLSVENWLR